MAVPVTGDVRQTGDWLVTLAGRVTGLGDTNGDTGHQWDDQTGDINGMGHLFWDINVISFHWQEEGKKTTRIFVMIAFF